LASDEAAIAGVKTFLPVGRVGTMDPEPGVSGITEPTTILEYDYFVYASKDTPDDAVRGVIKGLIEGREEMMAMVASFRWFDPAVIATDIGLPYHPAAEAYYKEAGLWPKP
jgi:hypothetical protein